MSDTDALVERFDVPVPREKPYDSTCPEIHEDGQALQVLKLQNAWAEFCRKLVFISATGDNSRVQEAARSIATEKGFDYPVWHSSEFVVRVAKYLILPNADEIELHIGADLSAGRITSVRNYIVHPGIQSESKYVSVAAAEGRPNARVAELLSTRLPGGATLFEKWVRALQRTATQVVA